LFRSGAQWAKAWVGQGEKCVRESKRLKPDRYERETMNQDARQFEDEFYTWKYG
jgi:hypothetical protein